MQVALVTLIPLLAASLGGIIAVSHKPTPKIQSLIQHFAAGVVFAGVGGVIIPAIKERSVSAAIIGLVLGLLLVLAIQAMSRNISKRHGGSGSLALTSAVDLALDGLPVGIGFAIGGNTGFVLAIALSLELFSLSLAVSGGMKGSSTRKFLTATALGGIFWVSAIAGAAIFVHTSMDVQTVALAVGSIVFLYLAAEELLSEAHEVEETFLSTIVFFAGFILLFILEMLI
jgi:ZIP family zinc transporter